MSTEKSKGPEMAGLFITYFDFEQRRVPLNSFLKELSEYHRSDLIQWASTLLHISSELFGQSPEVQKELAQMCFEGENESKALQLLSRPQRQVIFHRKPLWLLIQFASMVCSDAGLPVNDPRTVLGRFVLICSDSNYLIQRVQVSIQEDVKDRLEWQATLLLTSAETFPYHNHLARAHAFWFESIQCSEIQEALTKYKGQIGLDEAFKRQNGLALSDCFFALVTIYKYLFERSKVRPVSPIILTVEGDWWGSVGIPLRCHILKMLSIPMEAFPEHLLGTPRQSWATDLSSLMNHPFIEVEAGHYICPDVSFLRSFFIDGVYWILDKSLDGAEWGNVFGAIYEWYITKVFLSSMRIHPHTKCCYYSQIRYSNKNDQVCDGLLLSGKHAFIGEFKGTRLTTRQKSGVSVEETIEGIKKSVASKSTGVGQLAKNITRILKGETVYSGEKTLNVASQETIVPVLVWHEEAAVNVPTRIFLDNFLIELLQAEKADTSRVGELLLLSTHDLEVFEQCSHLLPPDTLLIQYSQFVRDNRTDPKSMFFRFVVHAFAGRQQPKGFIGERIDRLFESVRQEHINRGTHASGS
jgi:hypothetical protein